MCASCAVSAVTMSTRRLRAVSPVAASSRRACSANARDAHVGQYLVCGAQVGAGIQAAALAAQPSAIEQVSAGELGAEPAAAGAVDRLVVQILGSLQRPRP
jgi:hypothetical protein